MDRPEEKSSISGQAMRDDIQASGPYRVIEKLGSGGMGTVYLAEQLEPVRRKVAIKLIRFGTENDLFHSRFKIERQALALMNHPNIASVYDAGTTRLGRPFFVMEAIDGISITKYADDERLNIDQRLELFQQVCHGIHHAHQKGVIHRDIKPSNILVSIRDGIAIPKIIDFGMAKGSDPTLEERGYETPRGVALGTPLYMCPEQIRGDGFEIDTRTDVYALGVVLYQLLSGAFPFETDSMSRVGLINAILNEAPPTPSHRFDASEDRLEIARERRTPPHELIRRLKDDLDHITMKALHKDPESRYASVAELSADLDRHAHHQVVTAAPHSAAYRMSKFIARHKVAVATGAIVLAALVLGVVGTSVGMIRAIHAREHALRAERNALATVAHLQKILSAADPTVDGRKVRVVDLLEKASKTVSTDLQEQPEVVASVRQTIGWTFLELGLYDRAEGEIDEAVRLRTEILGPDHPDTLAVVNARGRIDYKQGRYAEAERIHRRIWNIQKEQLGPENEETLWSMYNLAKSLTKQDKLDEAESLLRENARLRKKVNGPDHPHTLVAINSLCMALTRNGKHGHAETLERQNLKTLKRVCGDTHPNTLNAMSNLVVILKNAGKIKDAQGLCRQTLELQSDLFGDEHPETLFTTATLASLLELGGQYAEAIELHDRTLKTRKRVLGPTHPLYVHSALGLARLLTAEARYIQAEKLLLDLDGSEEPLDSDLQRDVCQSVIDLYQNWKKPRPSDKFFACDKRLE